MTLIKFEPLKEFEALSDRIQKMLTDFPGEYPTNFNPKIDISEDDSGIYVEVEVPGIKKDDLKISMQDNILTIIGEKKNETEEHKGKSYYRSERSFGSFQRSFTLPAEIDRDRTEAKFEDGILKINIAKAHPKKSHERTIEIK